jgi:hypothetical protein
MSPYLGQYTRLHKQSLFYLSFAEYYVPTMGHGKASMC